VARLRVSQKEVNRWKDNLTLADRKFKAEAEPFITKMRSYLLGNQWPDLTPDKTAIQRLVVNLILADIKVMLPTLALRNPRIFVKPTGATMQMPDPNNPEGAGIPVQMIPGPTGQPQPVPLLAAAKAKEALVNWRWKQLRVTTQVRRALVDSLLSPFGIVKLGFTVATEKVDIAQDGSSEELIPHELIKAESPFAVRWSPLDFRVDPDARYPTLEDARWIAFGYKMRLSAIQASSKFKNTKNLQPTVESKQDYQKPGEGSGSSVAIVNGDGLKTYTDDPDAFKLVQLWEIWDKENHQLITLADDHDKALEYRDWPTIHKGFPCKTLVFLEHPDVLYGPPDLWHVLGQQDAYNQVATMILNHVRRFVRKYTTPRGAFDDKELEKLQMPIDGMVLQSESDSDKAIQAIPDAPIPVDWWQTRVNFRDDHDRVSGVADFVRGVAEKVDTATEASLLQSNLNVRTNDARDVVETFAEGIADELLNIDCQTINIPKAIPVLGPDGAIALNEFVHVQTRETLLADADVEIEIGSMQPTNQQLRKKDTLEVYTLFRNDPLVDQVKLRTKVIPAYRDSIPDIADIFYSKEQAMMVMQQLQGQAGGGAGSPPPGAPGRPATPHPPGASPQARPSTISHPTVPGSEAPGIGGPPTQRAAQPPGM
jgi:hypothetical protein